MFNFQRWKVRRFLGRLHRGWAEEEKAGKEVAPSVEQELLEQVFDAPLSPASNVFPLPQKKRKEKKVKGKTFERKPWANLPRPAGKAAWVRSIAQAEKNGNIVSAGGAESFRQTEDFFGLLPIDECIPPNFDKECFKAVIIFGFLRPADRYKPINFNYVPAEDILRRVVNKGYRAEEVKRVLEWLRTEQLVIRTHLASGWIPMSLNIKPWSISGAEAKKICQACTDALAKLRVAR